MPHRLTADAANVLEIMHPIHAVGWKHLVPQAVLSGEAGHDRPCMLALRVERGEGHVVARAEVTNTSERTLRLSAIRWVADRGARGATYPLKFPHALEPFYFATENFRGDWFGIGTTEGEHYFRAMPHETVKLGLSEDLVFPGLFVGSRTQPVGAFCAAASAERFHTTFLLRGGSGPSNWGFEIEELPQGLEWVEIAPGETLAGERIFFGVVDTADPQQATAAYYDVLEAAGAFERNRVNPLPKERIWCSWNYAFMDRIDEEAILRQLPVIAERFPMVKFVQIDDGYERLYPAGNRAMVDFLYRTDQPYNPEKFPHGPKYIVDKIKAAGLRPATWIGFWIAGNSDLVREHPDWLLCDDMGMPIGYEASYGNQPSGVVTLDVSVPGVRDYIERMCETVFGDWGFEGIKLDFFSFPFQCRRVRYREGKKTAMEYWRWLVDVFRRHLPEDGFLGLCSVAGSGSPILGWGADYHRSTLDIGMGTWPLAKRISVWDALTNMLLQRRPVLQNIDSIGCSPDFTDAQWKTWLNVCAVSGSAMEVSGDLSKLTAAQCTRLNRTLELSDPFRRVWCADVPAGKIERPPALWLAEGGSGRMAAIINWEDAPADVDVRALTAAWPDWTAALRPAWPEDASCMLNADAVRLDAHASLLLRGQV